MGLEHLAVSGIKDRTGGLAGENRGSISNCHSAGSIKGANHIGGLVGDNYGDLSYCYSTADVNATDEYAGGLVAWNYGSVSDCYATGSVSGDVSAGGLIGLSGGVVSGCYSAGDVTSRRGGGVGGLMALNYESVTDCYSRSNVKGRSGCGGLIGRNYDSVLNCYSTGDVHATNPTSTDSVGGMIGSNYSDSVSNCLWDTETQTHGVTEGVGSKWAKNADVVGLSTAEMQTKATFTSAGWDFAGESANGTREVWQMPVSGGYPVLSLLQNSGVPFPLAGRGTISDPYLIGDANELGMVNWYPEGSCFKLTSDINLSGTRWSGPVVPEFGGSFDGAAHRLENVQISGHGRLGFVGCLGEGGEVRNLRIEGGAVIGTEKAVGGLVGENRGDVSNCYFAGDVNGVEDVGGLVGLSSEGSSISGCYFMGDVNGFECVGGLVGENYGSLSESYTVCDVNASEDYAGGLVGRNEGNVGVSNCHAVTYVRGRYYLGGLLGYNARANVTDCYSTGVVKGSSRSGGLIGQNGDDEDEDVQGGVVVNCFSKCPVEGGHYVGGLVGWNNGGHISDCNSTGDATGSLDFVGGLVGRNDRGNITRCHSMGNVHGHDYIGGLVGYSLDSSVWNCYSTGDVRGAKYIGGLIGANGSRVWECYSIGSVRGENSVGGLVGINSSIVWGCYSTGDVEGSAFKAGGLVGHNVGNVANCYSTGDVDGNNHIGGLIGSNYEHGHASNCFWDTETQTHGVTESVGHFGGVTDNVAGLTTVEMQTESTFTSAGWDFLGESANGTSEIWQIPAGGGYPVLSLLENSGVPFPLAGAGTIGDPYLVADANELGMVRWYPEDCSFRLTTDIDLSGIAWSGAIVPAFGGFFDGNGHKLMNMQISGGGWLGLFGGLAASGQVKNLGLEGASVRGIWWWIGGLVAENRGTVSSCYSMGGICGDGYVGGLIGTNYGNLLNSHSVSDVNGASDYVGGLVGSNLGSISNCYSSGKTSGENWVGGLIGSISEGKVTNSYSVGEVTGVQGVGGLAGRVSGDVLGCYSKGTVTGSTYVGGLVGSSGGSTSGCYSTGDVTGGEKVGGLVGGNSGDISECYSIGKVYGGDSVGGLIGGNSGDISKCYSAGSVRGDDMVGGFVGYNIDPGEILNCCSVGDTNGVAKVGGFVGHNDDGAEVSNCYAAGDVNGITDVGGLVGHNEGSRVLNCFWDIEMQSHGVTESIGNYEGGTVDNVVGLLSREMVIKEMFTSVGWDFAGEEENGTEDVWTICSGTNYPRFAWQIRAADFLCPNGITGRDFAFFALYWLSDDCGPANQHCSGTDLDLSGRTAAKDLELFAEGWLDDATFVVRGPQPPARASDPSPVDGAVDVKTDAVLNWQSGYGAVSTNVYFGITNPPDFRINQRDTIFEPGPLANGATYYWRIDEVNEVGTTTGRLWSFTTGSPPAPATMPVPPDGAVDVSTDPVLRWKPGADATSHDVYFGTVSPGILQGNQMGASFVPGKLAYGQTYYWRVDERNTHGATTGSVWSFRVRSSGTR